MGWREGEEWRERTRGFPPFPPSLSLPPITHLADHLILGQEVGAGQVVRIRAGRQPGAAVDVEPVAAGLDKADVAPGEAPSRRDGLHGRRRARLQGSPPLRLHGGRARWGQPLALLPLPDVGLVQAVGGGQGGGRGGGPPQARAQALRLDVGAGRLRLGLLLRCERGQGGGGLVHGGRGGGRGQRGKQGQGQEGGGLEEKRSERG